MKIIKHSNNYAEFDGKTIESLVERYGSDFKLHVDCPECGCEFEYTAADIMTQTYVGAAADAIERGTYGYRHYVICPECGRRHRSGSTLRVYEPDRIPSDWPVDKVHGREWNGKTYGCINWAREYLDYDE